MLIAKKNTDKHGSEVEAEAKKEEEDDQDHDHKAQKETESEGNEAWIEIEKAIVIGDKKEEGKAEAGLEAEKEVVQETDMVLAEWKKLHLPLQLLTRFTMERSPLSCSLAVLYNWRAYEDDMKAWCMFHSCDVKVEWLT